MRKVFEDMPDRIWNLERDMVGWGWVTDLIFSTVQWDDEMDSKMEPVDH